MTGPQAGPVTAPQTSGLLRIVGADLLADQGRPAAGLDSCIISAPEQTYTVTADGTWLLHVKTLGKVLRQVSEDSAEQVGEKLHHADWVLTTDPAVIRGVNVHDCPRCRAGTDQALAALAAHPTVPLLAGVLYWAG